ncbi:GntR family transcriptional regulator [Phytoactinopolyspora mesophila]|uniref:GntR family transcriptional regulator n=1 Tax=Phytoactinopolyspora mesophila TaxID=2650750 RepID=A0A7K3M436_9ACTN|nr:GntR family transcriptional regulator [Phytoactinopolyspora mesophila]NDL58006.1 GntR family transcriptional regulator [Phytoactinopolyspora mesophila]
MLIRLDPSSPVPLFAQLAAAVRGAAARGELRPGERLPGARELAESLGVNMHTALRGYQQLRDEGLIELRRGRGAVLTEQASEGLASLREAVAELVSQARRFGLTRDELIELITAEYPEQPPA